MQIKNEDRVESINYFVRQKITSGAKLTNTELWAKEWLDYYAKNQKKTEQLYYDAYHAIPEYVMTWEKRLNVKNPLKPPKNKTIIMDFTFKHRAEELLVQNRYKTIIPFNELKWEEYKMICDHFEKGKIMPDYLKGIVQYQPTLEERIEKILGQSIKQAMTKTQNIVFYLFLGFFFLMLMLLNL